MRNRTDQRCFLQYPLEGRGRVLLGLEHLRDQAWGREGLGVCTGLALPEGGEDPQGLHCLEVKPEVRGLRICIPLPGTP